MKNELTHDTPRTDAQAGYEDASGCWKYRKDGSCVDADFARELERENAKLREVVAGIKTEIENDSLSTLIKVDRVYCVLRDFARKNT